MSSFREHLEELKKDKNFAEQYDLGYEEFKIGVMLKVARRKAGLTQNEIADRIHSTKSAVSRMENHAENVKLSTLEKYAKALNKHLEIKFV